MKLIKIIIIQIVLIVSLQSWIKADDIRDFQIEGISIGDSLLKYFSKKDVKKSIAAKQGYHDKSFVRGVICDTQNKGSWCNVKMDMNTYDAIQFHFKKKDPEYVLFMLSGILEFPDKIQDCKQKKKNTVEDLTKFFPTATQENSKEIHPNDKTKKSLVYITYFYLNDGSASRIQCYDWSKKMGFTDHLKITLDHPEYIDWMKNKAWK